MVKEITWDEFRNSGLLLIVNQILHIFGLAIVMEMKEDDPTKVARAYPARVKFRGFGEESLDKAYVNISKYMAKKGDELLEEVLENA